MGFNLKNPLILNAQKMAMMMPCIYWVGCINTVWGANKIIRNQKAAFHWLSEAAKQGHANAQLYVGYEYMNGLGTAEDKQKAAYWYHAAALQGNVDAEIEYAQLLFTGTGTDKNYDQSVYWFKKAAEQGDSFAQAKMAYLYLAGLGVDKDESKAYGWLKLAANNHNDQASAAFKKLEALISEDNKQQGEKYYQELSNQLLHRKNGQ